MIDTSFTLHRMFVSEGHNYFGHKGTSSGTNPVVEKDSLQLVAGKGIVGDRFFSHAEDYKGQITFFAFETHADLCAQFGCDPENKPLSMYRRNVITGGVDLNALIGTEFELQGVRFFGTEECRPCFWMDEAFQSGACEAMKGRGGLRAKILNDGILKIL